MNERLKIVLGIIHQLILKGRNMLFKMVLTRSQEKKIKDDNAVKDDEPTVIKTRSKLATFIKQALKKPKQSEGDEKRHLRMEGEEGEEEDEEEVEEEDDLYDDDYTLPSAVENCKDLSKRAQNIIDTIQKRNPSLETILKTKLRMKDKIELFELFFIYRFSEPNTEDRLYLKRQINDKLKESKILHKQHVKHRELIQSLEKKLCKNDELYQLKNSILELDCTMNAREYLYRKYQILENSELKDEEYFKIKIVLKEALQLPFQRYLQTSHDTKALTVLENIRKIFDQELFGMDNVKEQLLLFFHERMCNPTGKGCCLGLVGPAGVGKTTIAHCLAKVLGLPFEQIALGGVSMGESIKGHDSTYIGSRPGQIARAMMKLRYRNGILFFDEFDKIDGNPDIVNSMLHITDFSQNHQFRDNFFGSDLDIDLSSLWFVCSMNEKCKNPILADRIFFVHVDGYSFQEKQKILKDYILPKLLKDFKQEPENLIWEKEMISYFIQKSEDEDNQGIRNIQAKMRCFLSKLFFLATTENKVKVSFSLNNSSPVTFPFTVTKESIDILLKEKKPSIPPNIVSMYV